MSVEARQNLTVAQLIDAMGRYVSEQAHSRDVAERWLVSYLVEPLRVARQVRNGRLDPEFKVLVDEFRRGEIEKEKKERQRQIDELDREASRLSKPG